MWRGNWRVPAVSICRPTGRYYRLPGLRGAFDNGEKWKDSRVLHILKLEGLGRLDIEDEERGLIEVDCWVPGFLGKKVLSTDRGNTDPGQDTREDHKFCYCRLSLRSSLVFLKDVKQEMTWVWIQKGLCAHRGDNWSHEFKWGHLGEQF